MASSLAVHAAQAPVAEIAPASSPSARSSPFSPVDPVATVSDPLLIPQNSPATDGAATRFTASPRPPSSASARSAVAVAADRRRSWAYRARTHPWAVATVVSLVIFVDMVVYAAVIPILPDIIQHKLGLSSGHTGLVVGAYAAGLLLFTPIFGFLSDRLGDRKWPMIISLIGLAAASGLFLVCTQYWHFLLVRALQGIAAAGNWTVGLALASDAFPADRLGTVMGVVLAAMNAGYLVGPAVGGALYTSVSEQSPFYMFLVLTALALAARVMVDERHAVASKYPHRVAVEDMAHGASPTSAAETTARGPSLLVLVRARPIWVNSLVVVVTGMINAGLEPILPTWLSATFGTSVATNGLMYLAISIPSLLASVLIGFLCDRYSARVIQVAGLAALAMVLPLLALPPSIPVAIVVLIVFGCMFPVAATPPLPEMGTYVHAEYPGAAGSVYSMFNLSYALAIFVGPVFAGFVYEEAGYWACLGTFAGVSAAMGGVYLWYHRIASEEEAARDAAMGFPALLDEDMKEWDVDAE
ncbi:hypothetical protein GGF31_001051 [Allomyces arbusculus]|nr:hypothetical protein GGF31_001051 [Allomyces arbusculus]